MTDTTMALEIPAEVVAEGRRWSVERAWPDGSGGATVELRATGTSSAAAGLSAPGVRAGVFTAAAGIVLHPAGQDDRLPALADLAREGTVVSHRAGRRAVVKGTGAFTKVVRPGRAAAVRTAHEGAGRAGFARGFELARSWASPSDEQRGIVHFSMLEGRTLHEIGADRTTDDAAFVAAWRAWGDAWVRVLDAVTTPAPTSPAESARSSQLAVHGVVDEIAVVRTWAAHAQRVLPARADGIHHAQERVCAALAASAPDPLVLAHRDLHDKQVLQAPGARPSVLDLDTASRAEAALDLGNLRAHLAFRTAQGALSPERAQSARGIIDEVAERCEVSPERLAAYESATALRLGCLYLFRPKWRALAQSWLSMQGG